MPGHPARHSLTDTRAWPMRYVATSGPCWHCVSFLFLRYASLVKPQWLTRPGQRPCWTLLPVGLQHVLLLVVTSKAVDTALHENETELGVLVLAVLLKVLADVDSLLDKVV